MLVIFGLFDDTLPQEERQAMAEKLLNLPPPVSFEPGKPHFPTNLVIGIPSWDQEKLVDISQAWGRRRLVVGAGGGWLGQTVAEWDNTNE